MYRICISSIALLLLTSAYAYAACSSPNGVAGSLDYDETTKTRKICDGTNWKLLEEVDHSSVGARQRLQFAYDTGSCTPEKNGRIRYDGVSSWEYCNGNTWLPFEQAAPLSGVTSPTTCPPATDLVGHFKFDETSGTVATDNTGTGNGTVYGGAVWQPTSGRDGGGALLLDEVNDYVTLPDRTYGPAMTVTFWYKPTDHTGTTFQYLYSHGTVDANNSLNIYCAEENHATDSGNMLYNLKDSSGVPGTIGAIPSICQGTDWIFVAIMRNLNASFVFRQANYEMSTGYNASPGTSFNPSGLIYIGGRNDLDAGRFAGGLIDDLRIYNRNLKIGEMNSLYFTPEDCM